MTYSVFSKHIIWRATTLHKLNKEIDIKSALNMLDSECEPHLVISLNPVNEIANDNILYLIATNPDVRKVVSWASTHILNTYNTDSYITRNVKIRIFTDMLNKCNIDKMDNIYMHDNFVKHMSDIFRDLINDQLPF